MTKPRPLHHHGNVPVLEVAEKLNLPIIEVSNKKESTDKVIAAHFSSRLGVLIDFGILIEQKVIDSFSLGIVNSHFSLLPQWRGADPITFSILSGQSKTGVSLMLLVEAMDEGPLLAVSEMDVPPGTTTPELTQNLIELSDTLLKDVLPKYTAGKLTGSSQEKIAETVGYSARPTYSRKLTKEDGILDWRTPAKQLEREIRAYIEWPKSRCILGGHAVIVTASHVITDEQHSVGSKQSPGSILVVNKTLTIQTSDGKLAIDRIKPAGKHEMSIDAFLNGYGKDL